MTKGKRSLRMCDIQATVRQGGHSLKYTGRDPKAVEMRLESKAPLKTNKQGFPSDAEGCVNTARQAE